MRVIGSLEGEHNINIFSNFLNRKGISHQMEIEHNNDWGSPEYGTRIGKIWINDEDQVDDAIKWLAFFRENPFDSLFLAVNDKEMMFNQEPSSSKIESPPTFQSNKKNDAPMMGPITRILILGCTLLFFLSQFLTPSTPTPSNLSGAILFTSPLQKNILYDYPYAYELISRLIKLYGYEALEKPQELPVEGQQLVKKINETPYWQGLYQIILKDGFQGLPEEFEKTPKFEKIKQGQLWRLISPIFFHADLLHLFFNMLWLLVLGKQMEQRIGGFKYILFIILVGIFSNTAQYLMSGPNFIGFSGVLCGMLTFIWIRQKKAPWEGYQLDKMTILFMLLFIVGMAAIQFFSFILEKSLDVTISPGIANMAHLSGAFIGYILGKMNFFSREIA